MKRQMTLLGLVSVGLFVACSSPTPAPQTVTDPHFMDFDSKPEWTRLQVQLAGQESPNAITTYLKNGKQMFQGDIVIAHEDEHKARPQGAIMTTQLWTNKTVPYVIDSSLSGQTALIQQAVNYYNTNLNLKWVPRTNQTNYVRFFKGDGCWSYVGMNGNGQQDLSLGDGCHTMGIVLHEMTHASGAQHEQTRSDRDQYITVNWNAIPADWQSQYQILPNAKPYGAYDFYSIMHYGLYWGNQLAMTPKVSGIDYNRVGNGSTLTATDIAGINSLYPSTGGGGATSIANGGIYRIQNLNSNKCMDVDGVSSANGASVKQYACINQNVYYNQDYRFKQVNTPEGVYYQIQAVHSGKCIDIQDIATGDGAKLHQWDCHANPDDAGLRNQLLRPAQVATAVWQFGFKHSSKCLDVPGSSLADVQLQQWTCNATNAQRFRLIPVSH